MSKSTKQEGEREKVLNSTQIQLKLQKRHFFPLKTENLKAYTIFFFSNEL